MKERTITLACGALCALVFVSALFTPGQARGAVLDKPADVTAHPVQVVDPTPTLTAAPISSVCRTGVSTSRKPRAFKKSRTALMMRLRFTKVSRTSGLTIMST